VVRNVALELATPSQAVNDRLYGSVLAFHKLIGIAPDDPRTTWPRLGYGPIEPLGYSEDHDGNPLYVLLVCLAGICLLFAPIPKREIVLYGSCILAGFVLFCLLLKWQPWATRLHLPLLVLAAPLVGRAADTIRSKWVTGALALLVFTTALPWVFWNQLRPIAGQWSVFTAPRQSQYFKMNRGMEKAYVSAVRLLAKSASPDCKYVGIDMQVNEREYPLWLLVREQMGHDVVIEAIGVDNVSARLYDTQPPVPPCGILSIGPTETTVAGVKYVLARQFEYISLLTPEH